MPLWNPYQGLGQPFAAMGEGSPYFPPAMIRSLAPYSLANVFLLAEIFLAQCFMFCFLRNSGLGRVASVFGGVAFALSGAVSFHLARANILDQICMIPVLFWAISNALVRRSIPSYIGVALVTALHVAAGFVQIAMISQGLVLAYAAVNAQFASGSQAGRARWLAAITIATVIGLGLSAFYLLPLLDWLTAGFGKNVPLLGFLQLPYANLLTFFFPLLFGSWFGAAWMPTVAGAFSAPNWAVHWDNLYAISGTAVLLISASAVWGTKWPRPQAAYFYFFFLIAGAVLALRYVNIAPVSLVNWLPIIGRQSPKHANAVMVFCFVVAASAAVDNLRNIDLRKATLSISALLAYVASVVAGMFGTYVYSLYETGTAPPDRALVNFAVYGTVTAAIVVAAVLCIREGVRRHDTKNTVGLLLVGLVAAELLLYVPLGKDGMSYIIARFLISASILAGAYAAVFARHRVAVVLWGAAIAGFTAFLFIPWSGLPRAFDLTKPPTFMSWLADRDTKLERTFGIFPDYSVAAQLQDISVVGPLAPFEYKDFVWLISNERAYTAYVRAGHFMLAGNWHYEAEAYFKAKPILDWLGVRYLVLDHGRMPQDEQDRIQGRSRIDGSVSRRTRDNSRLQRDAS